jgi:hypothetical protein
MKVNTLIASKSFGVSEPYIVPGNGAAELIKVLMEDITKFFAEQSGRAERKVQSSKFNELKYG